MAGELLDVAEVAALLKLRPVTIYRWCRAGRLPGVKLGKEWRIPRAALAALLPPRGEDRAYEDMPMNEVSPAAWALARRLLRHEADGRGEPAAVLAAAGRIHGRLRGRLAGVIGATGFATLFARARRLAQAESPAVEHLAFDGGPRDAGPRPAASGGDPAATAAGVTAVLATFIGLLSTFIGEDLALRLVRDAWPEVADDMFGVADGEVGA
ncbi:MAG TPA: helix-turn-helix domain-containing protein [Thermomicrobiales bacterium]|nr:helix-turn-helix domain-containing protein [Thermomicrobiales bacterium]